MNNKEKSMFADIEKILDRADELKRQDQENPKPKIKYSDMIARLRKELDNG